MQSGARWAVSRFILWNGNWDLQKAFDHVDRQVLWKMVEAQGFPMDLLATSLVSYGWGRNFVLNTEVSRRIYAHRGIAAGSPYAPYELAVHLVGLIEIVRQWNAVEQCRRFFPFTWMMYR